MLRDSLFSDAGWLFFAIWSIVIAALSFAAFAGDLLQGKRPAISPAPSGSTSKATQNGSGKL